MAGLTDGWENVYRRIVGRDDTAAEAQISQATNSWWRNQTSATDAVSALTQQSMQDLYSRVYRQFSDQIIENISTISGLASYFLNSEQVRVMVQPQPAKAQRVEELKERFAWLG